MAGDSPREFLCQSAQAVIAAGLRLDDGGLLAMIMAAAVTARPAAYRTRVPRGTAVSTCLVQWSYPWV
jgi:hypothetical protein